MPASLADGQASEGYEMRSRGSLRSEMRPAERWGAFVWLGRKEPAHVQRVA